MQQQKPLQKLMNSEMSRREFLGFMGAALLAAVGISGLLRGLGDLMNRNGQSYGATPYGGGSDGGFFKP